MLAAYEINESRYIIADLLIGILPEVPTVDLIKAFLYPVLASDTFCGDGGVSKDTLFADFSAAIIRLSSVTTSRKAVL